LFAPTPGSWSSLATEAADNASGSTVSATDGMAAGKDVEPKQSWRKASLMFVSSEAG